MKIEKLFSVEKKVVLITGGSRGIGEMIARGYLANGATVYITARKVKECKETAEKLSKEYNSKCIAIPGDLSDLEGIEGLYNDFCKHENNLDILINNAGAVWGQAFEEFSEQGWDKVMNLNVKTMFFLTKKFLELLKINSNSNNYSRVINIGSIDGINTPYYENYSYSIAKAAVHKLTKVLAAKLIKEFIICNAIAPGPFPSKMLGSAVNHDYSIIGAKNPSQRVGQAEDIAGLALFLSSRASQYTIGEIITCDGGLVVSAGHDLTNS